MEEMAREAGDSFDIDHMNLAEFSRRTGLSRSKARTLKGKGFVVAPHGRCGMRAETTVISGFEGVVNALLMDGVTNSEVIFERIGGQGYKGGKTTVKNDASYDAYTFEEKMEMLLDAEASARRARKVDKKVKAAMFKDPAACVEDIVYLPDRKLSKDRIARLAACDWVGECVADVDEPAARGVADRLDREVEYYAA